MSEGSGLARSYRHGSLKVDEAYSYVVEKALTEALFSPPAWAGRCVQSAVVQWATSTPEQRDLMSKFYVISWPQTAKLKLVRCADSEDESGDVEYAKLNMVCTTRCLLDAAHASPRVSTAMQAHAIVHGRAGKPLQLQLGWLRVAMHAACSKCATVVQSAALL